jgi:tetratricopeptide (TPR) repeat protein
MLRSLKVSNGWLKRVKQALSRYDFSSQKALAEELEISPRKASDFFNGKSVDYDIFVAICARLGLEWQKVAKVSSEIMKSIETSSQISAKAQELVPVPQPELAKNEIAKNIEDQAKKPDGIPKLASSLFRTFESQDYIPQKKFINVKSPDSPDSIEKSPDQLLDQILELVEPLVSEVSKPDPEPIPEAAVRISKVIAQPAVKEEIIEKIGIEEIQVPEPKIENKDLVQILEPLEPKLLEIPTNLSKNLPPSNTPTIAQELPTIAATHRPEPDQPKAEIKQIEPTKTSSNLGLLNLSDLLNSASIPVKSPVKKEEVIITKPLISNQVPIQIASQIPSKVPNSVTAPIIATIPQSYQPSSNNLEPILTAFYSACDAQDWDLAAALVNDINLTYIKKTSDLALILDLYNQLLPPKWQDGEQKISDRLSHWQVLYNAGLASSYLEKYTDAVAYYETALAIASNSEPNLESNTGLKIKALNGLGLIYQAVAQYQSALKYFQQAQVLAKESQDRPSELQALGNLGNIYYASRQYRTAINYYQGFLQLANGEDEIELEFLVIGNLGNAYYNLGEYQAAINYQQKYLEIAQMIGNSEKESGCLVSLGFTYYSLGLYQTAIEHYQNAKAIADKFTYQRIQLSIFSGLGLSYQALKNYSTAVICFHKCLEIAQKLGDRSAEVKALYNLRKANSYQ